MRLPSAQKTPSFKGSSRGSPSRLALLEGGDKVAGEFPDGFYKSLSHSGPFDAISNVTYSTLKTYKTIIALGITSDVIYHYSVSRLKINKLNGFHLFFFFV